jgi:RNA polymerase sigma-70 factor (ECF subfamily)
MAVSIAPVPLGAISAELLDELWRTSEAAACGLARDEFERIVLRIGTERNFGLGPGLAADPEQQAAYFRGLRLTDLVLARACASGNGHAWERFIELYRQPLLRAGIAITRSESLGRELADGLYAELYGLTVREGERRCPLDSYSGRGSLIGWLRTTLAQRHVDHHRRVHREEPLEEFDGAKASRVESAETDPAVLPRLTGAVKEALESQGAEDRFLLASYYLDGRTLHQLASVLGVHEATVSRKLKRATGAIRKQILRGLERRGMSRREAEEALATDPRDLTGVDVSGGPDIPGGPDPNGGLHADRSHLKLKELLQKSQLETFQVETVKEQAER